MGAGSSLIGEMETNLCSTRCDEMVDEACCQSQAKKAHFRRRAEGLIVVDPTLATASVEGDLVEGGEQVRARPYVHVQAFRQRRQSLLRPYVYGRNMPDKEYAAARHAPLPAKPTPRNQFSPRQKVSIAIQTQTPSYPAKAVVVQVASPSVSPSPSPASHRDQTPNSLERNAAITPGTTINGRTRCVRSNGRADKFQCNIQCTDNSASIDG